MEAEFIVVVKATIELECLRSLSHISPWTKPPFLYLYTMIAKLLYRAKNKRYNEIDIFV